MEKTLKVKFKIADIIEFEAEGTTEDVEKQRTAFMENIFPAAVNAVRANREQSWQQIKSSPIELLPIDSTESPKIGIAGLEDLSRTNLSSFLNRYGELSEQDFVLFAAYFDEKKNDKKEFNSDSVKKYYSEARRAPYSNNSMLISQLVKRGHIMQVEPYSETKGAKGYMLTDDGLKYVETYVAKEENSEKKIRKSRRNNSKIESQYKGLTADDLNLEIYPKVKDLEKSTEKVIMAMYIISKENKGEWFTVADIQWLLTNIFELPSTVDMINGVFKQHKSWFTSLPDEINKKASKRKLLAGAKDFAENLINSKKQ